MTGLLDEIRILDFSIWRPGPYTTSLLADIGADVLKVEPPGGDPIRAFPDLYEDLNRNKRGIMLDLKDPSSRARALELARDADVVVEAYRPGVAKRLGIGYEDIRAVNEGVIYCSISGYGQDGPLAEAPGHDINYQALSGGLIPRGGEAVQIPGIPIADLAAGTFGAFSICTALIARARTKQGERIDISMADVLANWTGPFPRTRVEKVGEIRGGIPSYGVFATADGLISLGIVAEDHFWQGLCDAMDFGEYRELTAKERIARGDELRSRITTAFAGWKRDELVDHLLAADVPVAPVLEPEEMLRNAHFLDRGTVTRTPWGDTMIAHPIRTTKAKPPVFRKAPKLDEHRGQGFDIR